MSAFAKLFGDELQSASGTVSTTDALANKDAVFIYFSAHWCPPCRGFTPKFADFHKKFAESKNFATVFVSSDKDAESFEDYFKEMPWLALPFAQRDLKNTLSKKYKVSGIPSLVLLDSNGDLITKDGREKVSENMDTCAGFPWKPKTFREALGDKFQKKDGSTVGTEAIEGKTLGLYFSAHWCPPCRGFTPVLKTFYEEYKSANANFEIIFVSSDRSENDMLDYFKNDHGDYLVLPFENREGKAELSTLFEVEGIPTFVIVDSNGKVLNGNGRSKVSAGVKSVLEEGWEPPLVGDLANGIEAAGSDLQESPAIIAMMDKCTAEVQQAARAAMTTLAKKYSDKAKASGDDLECVFLTSCKSDGLAERIKEITKAQSGSALEAAGDKPLLLMLDIPDQGGYYVGPAGDVTVEALQKLIDDKQAKTLTRHQLS